MTTTFSNASDRVFDTAKVFGSHPFDVDPDCKSKLLKNMVRWCSKACELIKGKRNEKCGIHEAVGRLRQQFVESEDAAFKGAGGLYLSELEDVIEESMALYMMIKYNSQNQLNPCA